MLYYLLNFEDHTFKSIDRYEQLLSELKALRAVDVDISASVEVLSIAGMDDEIRRTGADVLSQVDSPAETTKTTALSYMDRAGLCRCSRCNAELLCSNNGDMPSRCPGCKAAIQYDTTGVVASPWVCTDDDTLQFRRERFDNAEERLFELVQVNSYGDSLFKVAHGTVSPDSDADDDDVKQYILMYGWDETVIDSAEFTALLAEAIFETGAAEYDTLEEYETFEDAARTLGKLIGVDVSLYGIPESGSPEPAADERKPVEADEPSCGNPVYEAYKILLESAEGTQKVSEAEAIEAAIGFLGEALSRRHSPQNSERVISDF